MVHKSSTDPNSMLHSATNLHISQYVMHLAKLLNTSLLNNSREENQTCLAYGQLKMVPLSPSFLNQRGPVRFFYCSTKGFNAYSDEGLTNFSVL